MGTVREEAGFRDLLGTRVYPLWQGIGSPPLPEPAPTAGKVKEIIVAEEQCALIDDDFEPTADEVVEMIVAEEQLAQIEAFHAVVIAFGRDISEAELERTADRLVDGGYEVEAEQDEDGFMDAHCAFATAPGDALRAVRAQGAAMLWRPSERRNVQIQSQHLRPRRGRAPRLRIVTSHRARTRSPDGEPGEPGEPPPAPEHLAPSALSVVGGGCVR